jgi:hypothetical protein
LTFFLRGRGAVKQNPGLLVRWRTALADEQKHARMGKPDFL